MCKARAILCVQLRHPNILAFKETVEIEERGETNVYIMTEAVTSLSTVLRDNDLKGPERCVGSWLRPRLLEFYQCSGDSLREKQASR